VIQKKKRSHPPPREGGLLLLYLLGFVPATDGRLHKLDVRVTRPGMIVCARDKPMLRRVKTRIEPMTGSIETTSMREGVQHNVDA
jgi:hypothetical protein